MKKIVVLMTLVSAFVANATVYHVPVPDALQSASEYTPTLSDATVTNGILTVHYCLPPVLVGDKAPEFSFTGPMSKNFVEVKGDDVYGYCMVSTDKPLTCMLKYPGLSIDEASRNQAIKDVFAPADQENRLSVAEKFQSEPAGILSIEITP